MFLNPSQTTVLDSARAERAKRVFLVRGKQNNKPVWVYALIRQNMLPTFKHKLGLPGLDVSLYGEVLYSGWGKEPPENVINQLKKDFLQ